MKAYSKPDIAFEDFSLSTSIADNCSLKTNTYHQWSCGVQFGSMTVFTTEVVGCRQPGSIAVTSGEFNGLCYHVPTNGQNAFMS